MSFDNPPRSKSSMRSVIAAIVLVSFVVSAGAALAQTHSRGFVPPADYEKILEQHHELIPTDKDPLPSSFDWIALDGMTPAKNQGDCGSCWAFAATGEMEAKIRINYGKTLDLSEQQLVSCNPYGSGCGGGWAGSAYYVFANYGGVLEGCMPYEGSDSVPCTQGDYLKFADIVEWVSITNNVDQIKAEIMANGPVCTSVDANTAWDDYAGGIIDVSGSGTNHLVLIVGWDDRMGDGGVWIVKNSWGNDWGNSGYCYVEYGSCNIGTNVTALRYEAPVVEVGVSSPEEDHLYYADETVTVNWYTQNQPVATVDLYYGTEGSCQNEIIATDVVNTGSYDWVLPNVTTDRATVLVFPGEGTSRGFGFSEGEFGILGHETRFVSAEGSNIAPYDTPATAAHSIADAVMAGAGRDTIMIATGDYLETSITMNSMCHIMGGWNADFSERDPDAYPTRLRGVNGTIRFGSQAADYCGVDGITFHDCQGVIGSVPVNGRHGSAITSIGASPVIQNCRFENNRAEPGTDIGWGGAILATGGAPVIADCEFTGNVASHGGAIALSGCENATIERCGFFQNANSDSTDSFYGAAVYVDGGVATITDSEFRGGGAGRGGALAVVAGASVTGTDLTIAGNRSVSSGGGAYAFEATLVLERVDITGNQSWTSTGGGIFTNVGELQLSNVLMANNTASGLGGGIFCQSLPAGVIRNCVLYANSGQTGGGAFVSVTGPVQVYDIVAVENTGGGLFLAGTGIEADWNLAYGNIGGDFAMGQNEHDLVVDPVFIDAAGGDFAPGLHSPLIDSASQFAGADPDGGAADRGLHGGPTAEQVGPSLVSGLAGTTTAGVVSLTWEANTDAVTYAVYRDSSAVFVPASGLVCTTVTAPTRQCEDTPPTGDWYYVVCAVDADGHTGGFSERYEATGDVTAVTEDGLPQALAISRVSPNPFNPRTTVAFDLPSTGRALLQVFDVRGRLVRTLHEGTLPAGRHEATWTGVDGRGRTAAAGVYFVRLDDGHRAVTVKAVLAK